MGSLLGFSRGEDIFSSEKQQHPIFWDQALDLMAEPMTPVAMELRASPKAPRLTLSWRGRFWSKCYIIYLIHFCNGSINGPGRSCGGGVRVFNRRFSVGSQPLVNHRTASFSHQVVLEIGIMPPVRICYETNHEKVWILIEAGFHLRQLGTEQGGMVTDQNKDRRIRIGIGDVRFDITPWSICASPLF